MKKLQLPSGDLALQRMPLRNDDPLQAWDTGDEYLLQQIRQQQEAGELPPRPALLLVNDTFGALGTALAELHPSSWSDSYLAELALEHNLQLNGLDPGAVAFLPADREPVGPFELVLMKIPKSMAWWEDSLRRLRPALAPGAILISGSMIKHTPKRAYELLESIIGPTRTSLGWKKARLATSQFDSELILAPPVTVADVELPAFDLKLQSGANVFARTGLDAGTRLLLEALPESESELAMADLGCGNGVLALALARRNPNASILGVDESYQAVASARANANRAGLLTEAGFDRIRFEVGDGLSAQSASSLDLVICNPPFHQGQTQGDQLAWGMFRQARRALKPGGRLLIVGNRHLGYHVKLKRLFDRCETVRSDPRFVVLQAE